MNIERLEQLSAEMKERRRKAQERLLRRIAMGYVQPKPSKGIQHWHDTRTLVKRVTEAFDRNEKAGSGRICWINNRHQLQIRGKHLRRLLKAMPNVKQVGRKLVEEKV
jgi:hypothetical protein